MLKKQYVLSTNTKQYNPTKLTSKQAWQSSAIDTLHIKSLTTREQIISSTTNIENSLRIYSLRIDNVVELTNKLLDRIVRRIATRRGRAAEGRERAFCGLAEHESLVLGGGAWSGSGAWRGELRRMRRCNGKGDIILRSVRMKRNGEILIFDCPECRNDNCDGCDGIKDVDGIKGIKDGNDVGDDIKDIDGIKDGSYASNANPANNASNANPINNAKDSNERNYALMHCSKELSLYFSQINFKALHVCPTLKGIEQEEGLEDGLENGNDFEVDNFIEIDNDFYEGIIEQSYGTESVAGRRHSVMTDRDANDVRDVRDVQCGHVDVNVDDGHVNVNDGHVDDGHVDERMLSPTPFAYHKAWAGPTHWKILTASTRHPTHHDRRKRQRRSWLDMHDKGKVTYCSGLLREDEIVKRRTNDKCMAEDYGIRVEDIYGMGMIGGMFRISGGDCGSVSGVSGVGGSVSVGGSVGLGNVSVGVGNESFNVGNDHSNVNESFNHNHVNDHNHVNHVNESFNHNNVNESLAPLTKPKAPSKLPKRVDMKILEANIKELVTRTGRIALRGLYDALRTDERYGRVYEDLSWQFVFVGVLGVANFCGVRVREEKGGVVLECV